MYKHKKIISMLVLFSILCTTLFSYPIFASDVTITLNYSEVSVEEGGTVQLTATTDPAGLDIDWYCGDGDAEVSANGLVTGITAGEADIIVTAWDDLGNEYTAYCTVYVYKPDGVYYIRNLNSNYYLNVENGGITNGTNVNVLAKKQSASIPIPEKLPQMWKVKHLGQGIYTIRPMHKLNMSLDVTQNDVDIWGIGTSDTLDDVPSYAEWTFERSGAGYLLKNNNSRYLTMQIEGASTSNGANVIATSYSNSNNCRWEFELITGVPSGIYFYDTINQKPLSSLTRGIEVDETKTLSGLGIVPIVYSPTTNDQTFNIYTSTSSIVTVDKLSNGNININGEKTGEGTITVSAYRDGAMRIRTFRVCVGFPALFNSLMEDNIFNANELHFTDDGLFLSTTPLSEVLAEKGITYLPKDLSGSNSRCVNDFYDDWYLMSVEQGSQVSYGLYKMREQENDYDYGCDGDDPGVAISFVGLNSSKLVNCFHNYSTANGYELLQALDYVTNPGTNPNDEIITSYFADTSADGPYLIAELYIDFIVNCFPGDVISASNALESLFDEIDFIDEQLANPWITNEARIVFLEQKGKLLRIPNALEEINESAGRTIFNFNNMTLNLQNKDSLSLLEKQAILACFTANVTFNSFAAEVEFHAEAINDWKSEIPYVGDSWYAAAISADMGVGEDSESGFFDKYYDLNDPIVIAQKNEHGEF